MATRYYRVVKDHPLWEVGAILANKDNPKRVEPISDVWNKWETNESAGYGTTLEAAEMSDHYERVYEVGFIGKVKYLTKQAAQKVIGDHSYEKKGDK